MIWLAAALVILIELHGPEGQRFYVNALEITSIREPIGSDKKHFARGMRCIVTMTNGKFLPVRDSCDEVRDLVLKAGR